MGRSIFLSIKRKNKTFIYIGTPHAHAQGVPVFDSKEIVLSRADYSALLLAASSESLRKRLSNGSSSREARRARSPAALLPLSSWEQASFWKEAVSFSI